MSFIDWLLEWQTPDAIRREAKRFEEARQKSVHFSMTGTEALLLKKAGQLAETLERWKPGCWIEIKMSNHPGPLLGWWREDEGRAHPLAMLETQEGISQEIFANKLVSMLRNLPQNQTQGLIIMRRQGKLASKNGTEGENIAGILQPSGGWHILMDDGAQAYVVGTNLPA